MHRDKQSNLELLDELSGSTSISVTNTTIYGEHHNIERIRYLFDVFQLSKELFLIFYRVNNTKLFTINSASIVVISQKAGIPII